jgi:hypothetical protein
MLINEVVINLNHNVILNVGPGIHAIHHLNSLKGSHHHSVDSVDSASVHHHPVDSVESSTTVHHPVDGIESSTTVHHPVLSSDEFIIEIETVDHPVAHDSFITHVGHSVHSVESVESGDEWVHPVHSGVLGHEFVSVESPQMMSTEDLVEEVFPEESVPHSSAGRRVWSVHHPVPVSRLNSIHLHPWHHLLVNNLKKMERGTMRFCWI